MTAAAPSSLWDDLLAIWSRALALASNAAAPWRVRGRAASLCRVLAFEVAESDASALEVVSAATACIESFPMPGERTAAIAEALGVTTAMLAPTLRMLVQGRQLRKQGFGRGTRYFVR